jgi:hypothetical protein
VERTGRQRSGIIKRHRGPPFTKTLRACSTAPVSGPSGVVRDRQDKNLGAALLHHYRIGKSS